MVCHCMLQYGSRLLQHFFELCIVSTHLTTVQKVCLSSCDQFCPPACSVVSLLIVAALIFLYVCYLLQFFRIAIFNPNIYFIQLRLFNTFIYKMLLICSLCARGSHCIHTIQCSPCISSEYLPLQKGLSESSVVGIISF